MNQNKTPRYIKLDEHNHVEIYLPNLLDRLGWDIIILMQDLLTDKKHVIPLLTESQEVTA